MKAVTQTFWTRSQSQVRDILWRFDPLNLREERHATEGEYDDLGEMFSNDLESGKSAGDCVESWASYVASNYFGTPPGVDTPLQNKLRHDLRNAYNELRAILS